MDTDPALHLHKNPGGGLLCSFCTDVSGPSTVDAMGSTPSVAFERESLTVAVRPTRPLVAPSMALLGYRFTPIHCSILSFRGPTL